MARRCAKRGAGARDTVREATPMTRLARGDFHPFQGDDADYLYLVPSAAVVKLDDATRAVLDALGDGEREAVDLATQLSPSFPADDVRSAITELLTVRALKTVTAPVTPPPQATIAAETRKKRSIPLTTLVLNVTSKCNLSCGYCYEYGEDKIVEAKRSEERRVGKEGRGRGGARGAIREIEGGRRLRRQRWRLEPCGGR